MTLETKLVYSEYFSGQTGNKVYLKPENMQYTGAYKVRGAYYKISTMSEEERAKGLITASAGNHAQGRGLRRSEVRREGGGVVMPTTTPLMKGEPHQELRGRGGPLRRRIRRGLRARLQAGGGARLYHDPSLQ